MHKQLEFTEIDFYDYLNRTTEVNSTKLYLVLDLLRQ